ALRTVRGPVLSSLSLSPKRRHPGAVENVVRRSLELERAGPPGRRHLSTHGGAPASPRGGLRPGLGGCRNLGNTQAALEATPDRTGAVAVLGRCTRRDVQALVLDRESRDGSRLTDVCRAGAVALEPGDTCASPSSYLHTKPPALSAPRSNRSLPKRTKTSRSWSWTTDRPTRPPRSSRATRDE